MEPKQIKELAAVMEKGGLKKLKIKEASGFEIELEREDKFGVAPVVHAQPPVIHHAAPEHKKEEKKEGKYVTSPMVGTFYSKPSPDDPAFVKVGDKVEAGTVICIIEAMKVMNEVKAGASGTVAEICVENGHPLEFGTKIIRIV